MLPRFPFPLADFWVFLQNTYSTGTVQYCITKVPSYNLLYRVVHVLYTCTCTFVRRYNRCTCRALRVREGFFLYFFDQSCTKVAS